jgi:hypothetical protein
VSQRSAGAGDGFEFIIRELRWHPSRLSTGGLLWAYKSAATVGGDTAHFHFACARIYARHDIFTLTHKLIPRRLHQVSMRHN